MKSKISKQMHELNSSTEILRVALITVLVAASLIAAVELLSAFKQLLFG